MAEINFQQMRQIFLMKMDLSNESSDFLKMTLSNQRSLEENFSSIWKLQEVHQSMTPVMVTSQKSEDEATRLRTEGNDFYKKKNFRQALDKYNLSIINAPHPVLAEVSEANGETLHDNDCFVCPPVDPARYGGWTGEKSTSLAMGFANRSAIMYELELYDECLNDIDLALRYGYPDNARDKLEQRRHKCLATKTGNSSPNLKNGKALHPNYEDGRETSDQHITSSKPRLSSENVSLKTSLSSTKKEPPTLKEPNPIVPSLSRAIKITNSPSSGRGLAAARDIRPGEVLAVERAYSVILKENYLPTRCSTCMRLCLTPLPCPGCSKVIFCSESCRDRGLAEDHWIECKILPALIALEMDKYVMSYKMLKTFTFHNMKAMLGKLQKQKYSSANNPGFNVHGIYDSTSYQTVYHLCTNHESHPFETLLDYCLAAFVLTNLLEQSGRYFVDEEGDPVKPTESDLLQTGALLLNHIMKMKINTYQHGYIEDYIGCSLFPTASLVNHSCNPSLGYYMYGREIVLRALRPISSEEELTIAYSHTYVDQEKELRAKYLQTYFFHCSCEACLGNWPTLLNQPEIYIRCFSCLQPQPQMMNFCPNCKARDRGNSKSAIIIVQRIKEATDRSQELHAKHLANEKITEEDYHLLLEDTELIYKYFAMPSRIFNNFRINLESCFKACM